MSVSTKAPLKAMIILACLSLLGESGGGAAFAQSSAASRQSAVNADRAASKALTAAQREQVQKLFEAAFELLQAGDLESAQLGFERGLATDPANATATFYLAETLARKGDIARARTLYNKVIALEPDTAIALKAEVAVKALSGSAPATAAAQAPVGSAVAPLSNAREQALKAKDTFKECEQCPEMVVVAAGTFTMGSSKDEPYRRNDEEPQHSVTFARPFAIGKFTVTFDEWDACAADGGCNGYKPPDNGWGRGRQPVIFVSWNDAKNYLAWLSRKTGKSYRLPSEAEREYVGRAGTGTPFWWGAQISTEFANYNGNYAFKDGPKSKPPGRTVPVERFSPNAFGLHQVHGNVSEWTEDCRSDNYNGAPADGSPWISGKCTQRVVRNGSWDDLPSFLRAAARYGSGPEYRNYSFGFRVARDLDR